MSELESFVINYLRQAGSIVEPASPEVYEVLLPDKLADKWRVPAYQKIAFADVNGADEATRLGYNHRLVEEMATEARSQPASTRYYVNGIRLTKTGLAESAEATWALPNSRVVELAKATTGRVRSTYIRFNFKAALVSDEKQERLVSVMMDAHSGAAAASPQEVEQHANARDPDPVLTTLPDAPMRWPASDGVSLPGPLAHLTLRELLARAKTAVLQELAGPLQQLQRRTKRFRDLDEARLKEYYEEIEHDLKQRLSTASPDRRASLQEKVATVTAERAAKLADVVERYQVRLDLALLNVMVIVQPKLVLPVGIENRTTKIKTYAVYDPLLHRLEPLLCGVCGQHSRRTFLCHNGHLAHEECLAPACKDCKRVFCQQCAGEIGECEVCHEPLCRHSRIVCGRCGRGTCHEHMRLCHANEGQPVDLSAPKVVTKAEEPPPPPKPQPAPASPKKSKTSPAGKARAASSRAQPRDKQPARPAPKTPARKTPALPKGVPKPQRLEVVFDHDSVVAYLLASRDREVAIRGWKLFPDEGVVINCTCEKGQFCPADSRVMRPTDAAGIEKQLLDEIARFRQEYGLPPKRVNFNRAVGGQLVPAHRFTLYGHWKDDSILRQTQASFDETYGR